MTPAKKILENAYEKAIEPASLELLDPHRQAWIEAIADFAATADLKMTHRQKWDALCKVYFGRHEA